MGDVEERKKVGGNVFRGDARLRRYRRTTREQAADVGGADVSTGRQEAAKTGDAAQLQWTDDSTTGTGR